MVSKHAQKVRPEPGRAPPSISCVTSPCFQHKCASTCPDILSLPARASCDHILSRAPAQHKCSGCQVPWCTRAFQGVHSPAQALTVHCAKRHITVLEMETNTEIGSGCKRTQLRAVTCVMPKSLAAA